MRIVLALFALATLACAGGKPDNEDDPGEDTSPGGGDEETGAETDEESADGSDPGDDSGAESGGSNGGENGSENGSENGGSGPCPAYSGYGAAGARWVWAYNGENGLSGGWTTTLESLSAAGDWTLEMALEYAGGGVDTYEATYASVGYCDAEGAFVTSSRVDYAMVVDGRSYTGWSETRYDPPMLSVPTGLSPGDTFTSRASGTSRTNATSDTPFDYSTSWTVGDPETVSVPAGTFTTLPIWYTTGGTRYTTWLDADAGGVASDSAELLSWSP